MFAENVRFVNEDGHYSIYIDGRFYASADTKSEAIKEVETYFEEVRV